MNLRFFLFFFVPFISNYLGAEVDLPTSEELSKLEKKYSEIDRTCTKRILKNPVEISSFSSRGDARLFLGDFKGARLDYEKMIELNPNLEISHWRLGIAYFYLSEFKMASRQFEIYHQFDEVDRENGIWRFMSQFQLSGLNKARKDLLRAILKTTALLTHGFIQCLLEKFHRRMCLIELSSNIFLLNMKSVFFFMPIYMSEFFWN